MQYLILVVATLFNIAHASCASKYGHDITQAACTTFATQHYQDCLSTAWWCFGCCTSSENCYFGKWECTTCTAGYERVGNNRDRYEFGGKSIAAGTVSPSEYKWCKQCLAGSQCSNNGRTECGAGYYQNQRGQDTCKSCNAGQYTDQNARIGCKSCGAGRYGSCSAGACNSHSEDCPVCGPGTYQNDNGKTGCKSCAAGRYATNTANTLSTCEGQCGAGFYCVAGSTVNRQHPCTPLTETIATANNRYCPAGSGSYNTVTAGHYSTTTHSDYGSNSPNYYRDTQSLCNRGQMCVNGVQQNCPLGHYQDQIGKSDCNSKVCTGGYYCDGGAQSASPGVAYECGNARYYCPNTATNKVKNTVSPNYYTSCAGVTDPENDLTCPETRRTKQISCAGISAQYTCPGDGKRHRWIGTTTCNTNKIVINENEVGATVSSSPAQFSGYNSMAIKYIFGGGTSVGALSTCQSYFWNLMDQTVFANSGTIALRAGVALDIENGDGCREVAINVNAVPVDASLTYVSDTCAIKLSIGDVNDAPQWSNWEFSVQVEEDVAAKSIVGTNQLQVTDPDDDQITFSVSSTSCGGGSCDWFEIGSCDGKLRIKAGAVVKYSLGLGDITVLVTATDGALPAVTDENGDARPSATITVTIINRAEPPTVDNPTSFTISENIQGCNVAAGTQPPSQCQLKAIAPNSDTGKIIASDPDGSVLTYSTVLVNDPYFYVKESDGSLYIKQSLNYENIPSGLVLRTNVIDAVDGFTVEHSYAVAVLDVNDLPFPICATSIHVPEDTALNAAVPGNNVVGSISDEDCALGNCNVLADATYTIQTIDPSVPFLFSTTPSLPKLDVKGALDYETIATYTFTVIVTDKGVGNAGVGPFATGTCSLIVTVDDVNEAPIIGSGQTFSIGETAALGTKLGNQPDGTSLVASDPDNGGRFASTVPKRQIIQYRISTDDVADSGKFIFLNQYSGIFAVNGPLEADGAGAKTTYTLLIGVSDGSLESISDNVVITINQENEAPSFVTPGTGSEPYLFENSGGAGTIFNKLLSSADPDSGDTDDTNTFAIDDCTDGLNVENVCLFKVVAKELFINTVGITSWNFNYEVKTSYSLVISVTDTGGLVGSGSLTVLIRDTNDPPSLTTADATTSIGIQPDVGTIVAQLTGSDEDLSHPSTSESLTLTIASGNDDAAWEIVPPASGGNVVGGNQAYWSIRVKTPRASNLDTSGHTWNLVFKVTDAAGSNVDQNVVIVVQNGNARPTLVAPTPTLSIPENSANGFLVAAISTLFTDGTQADPITMFLTSVSPTVNPASVQPGQLRDNTGSGVGFFANVATELTALNTQGLFDFERFSTFRLFITGKDWPNRNTVTVRNFLSKSVEGIFDVVITDVNEPPSFVVTSTPSLLRVLENTVVDGTVADITAKDPDVNTILTFSLSSTDPLDSAPFQVSNVGTAATDANNNVARIAVKDSVPLNFEGSKTTFTMTLTASDGSLSATTTLQIDLDDAPEPPTLGDASTSVYENDGTWSYCLPFVDPDGASGNTFTLVDTSESSSGTATTMVNVQSPGCIHGVGAGFDYEQQDRYTFAVTVTDDSNSAFTDTGTLTVYVRDVMDTVINTITPSTLPTSGGQIVLEGKDIGPTAKKLTTMASDAERAKAQLVSLSYTNPTSGLTVSYLATGCTITASNTATTCTIPAGVGSEFTWTLLMGEAPVSLNQTLEFSNGFAYESPVITSVQVNAMDISKNEWTLDVETQVLTAVVGATITQNSWMLEISPSQGITHSAGVAVTQGTATGTLMTALQNEWTLTITSQVITAVVGATVTQGTNDAADTTTCVSTYATDVLCNAATTCWWNPASTETNKCEAGATGILKIALAGATTSVVVETASGITFLSDADVVIVAPSADLVSPARTTILAADLVANNNGVTKQVIIQAASGVTFDKTANVIIGAGVTATTIQSSNLNTITHNVNVGVLKNELTGAGTTSIVIETVGNNAISTDVNIVIDQSGVTTTVDHTTITAATITTPSLATLDTAGGTSIVITGTSLGPVGVQASAIGVLYASGLSTTDLRSNPSGYVATSCSVTSAHTEITCTSVPGIGKNIEFWISNLAGSYSNVLNAYSARFHSPTLISIAIKPGTLGGLTTTTLPTEGGTTVVLVGTNYGPLTTISEFLNDDLSSVTYGGATASGYIASSCTVVVAQTTIECQVAMGTGSNHKWNVVRGDQSSDVSTFMSSYAPPILNSVSGQSLTSADTQGGLRVTVLGSQFGHSVKNSITNGNNVMIKYGATATSRTNWYSCTDIVLVSSSNAMSCVMDPGTGSGHSMIITVDGQESNVLENAISYAPPVIISFGGPGATYANTSGNELIIITGRNFGPAGDSNIDSVRYGRSVDPATKWSSGINCIVVDSHFRMKCYTQAGGGTDLRWNLTIDGQNSTSPTTDYAPPVLQSIGLLSGGSASANGDEKMILTGANFGPVGKRLIDSVTFGPLGRQYTAKDCVVTWLSREITCQTPPGIGSSLRFYVNIAGQTSVLSSTSMSYALPVITTTSDVTIDTAGQSIDFTGTNFGLLVQGIGVKIMFGSIQLLASVTSQTSSGIDTVTVNIPPLMDTSVSMTAISTVLELTSGATVLHSTAISLAYNPPTITQVFTYEGTSAALRIVVQGTNLCGGVACGSIEVKDQNDRLVAVHRYISYSHDRIEMEMNTDKGSLRIAVGASAIGYQYSAWQTFEHMSPVIDNKDTISLLRFATKGGDLVTISGRYFRISNLELWVGNVQGTVISITQDAERGPHFYTVVGTTPPGQGLNNPLYIKLPSTSSGVGAVESEPAMMTYKAPTQVSMNVHHFPTTGGVVEISGIDLGLCAFLLVDNVKYLPNGETCDSTNSVTTHTSVTLNLPDGEGKGHLLSVSIGDQIVSSTSGWAVKTEQCNNGKGLDATYGWFDYDAPIVTGITPPTVSTSGGKILTIMGSNFGVTNPTISLQDRDSSTCTCEISLKTACVGGFGCVASSCCSATTPGCGCYSSGCNCCSTASTCVVTASTHTSITCELQEGQGTDLEIVVALAGQTSSDGESDTGAVTFSYLPPTIHSVYPLISSTKGGGTITLKGISFGLTGATVDLLGDGLVPNSPLSTTIGPIAVDFQNHTTVMFTVPEGHGTHRSVRLNVGGQTYMYAARKFQYKPPIFVQIEQPASCTTRVRTTACGSPTQGHFLVIMHGTNLGTMATSGATVTIGKQQCCLADKSITGIDDCATVGSAKSISCSCCVVSHNHKTIRITAPPGVGANVPVVLKYGDGYRGWVFSTVMNYDAPYINFMNPQLGNANGGTVSIHGINFGDVYNGGNVTSVNIGNYTCDRIEWIGTGPTDEAISCVVGKDNAGPKSIEITVGEQSSRWSASEWDTATGHRLYFAQCPPSFYGRIGEPCFECTYVTDNDGVVVVDNRGEKQYAASCSGGASEPIAKQGFYKTELHRQCGTDSTQICTNDTQCGENVACSFDHVIGEEYCNDTLKALRTSCSYILSCEPREACEAANVCSVIKEEMKDPISGVTLEPHGYANTTMAGIKVERCSECAKGYFRVGGRCELCPTDIMLLVALFICGIIGLCIGGYMLHVFKVNLAMASIGFDYMQVMSMFLKSDIRWPSAIRKLFRFMSAFNFDLDIASPECLVQEYYRFDIKWYSIMGMPLGMAFIFLIVHSMLWLKKKCIDQRTGKLNKHTHAMISMNLVMMYFLYLYVTKSALDVFNCVELDPPDAVHPEYTYMTAVGNVRCYQEGSLQMVLLPWAVLGILCYTLGYPIGLMILFWRNRVRIQRDQYLRACGKGDKREKNDLFNVYNIRKRYSALYYQFKPRCYYWAVVIIARKFSIASINLMLRQDVDYMLAASLLVMFVAFSVQLLNRPFMGPAEYQKVILNWNDRTSSVSALPLTINPLTVTTRGIKNDGGGGDTIISDGFSTLQKERSEQDKIGLRKRRPERSTMTLLRSGGRKGGTKCLQWLVNYNTVESVLLFCSVLIMLAGIMFSSSRFDNNKNLSELESITWITMIIIVISLMYYSIVFFLEIVAQTCPHRFCCDLSEHLGDHFVDRKKAKKKKKITTIGR